ncbi:exocyst complex component exo84 [Rhizoclosmatium sp. JEL0117]|nr:exocyst complex component exo84 [Rhizoclosmatium sp. JEL0117]
MARNITASTISTSDPFQGIDMNAYSDVDFRAETYLNGILAKLPEDGVRAYRATLKDAKDAAAKDLQRNVHKNYSEFVLISKEISSLEGDVLLLRGLLDDLSAVNNGYKMDQANTSDENLKEQDDQEASNVVKRSLNALTSQELQEQQRVAMENLYEQIEGLKKLLPISKSRYIVRDGADTRVSEINPSSYKQKQQVFMYVLNDTLLVVIKKKNILNGKTKLVIEKCFRLVEMAVIDMKDSSEITNAFKVMSHPDVFVYRTETWEEKRSLLATIKRVSDEIIGQKKKDKEAAQKPVPKIAAPDTTPKVEIDTTSPKGGQLASPKRDDLSQADIKWITELSYDLDVLIAHREFETAVTEILRARDMFANYPDTKIKYQFERQDIEDRVDVLASYICRDLANPIASKTQIQDNIDRLILLGLGNQARNIFLESRSDIIHHRIKLVKFDGDVADYVNDLSMVVFRLIRSTCDWYNVSFKETTMASGFLKWVRREIENFGDIIRRQVFESHKKFSVIAECLDHCLHHCEMLRDIGLELTFVLNQLFHHDLVAAIEEYRRRGKDNIIRFIDEDSFTVVECAENDLIKSGDILATGLDANSNVSVSVLQLYELLMDFGADMGLIMSISLYAKIVWCLTDFFSSYLIRIMDVFEKKWTNKQYYVMITNCGFVIDNMMPQVASQLAQRFDRSIPELDEHRGRLRGLVNAMQNNFVKLKVKNVIQNVFSLQAVDYSSTASILENAKPTDNVILFLSDMNDMLRDAENSAAFRKILIDIIHGVFTAMNEASHWENERGPLRFGFCGVQQLVLDIHFCLHVAEPFVNSSANELANKVCERALRTYFTQNTKIRATLKTGEWYDRRVQEETRHWNFPFLTMNELAAGTNQWM